jgi:uncharacterized protein (UPF0332 family)
MKPQTQAFLMAAEVALLDAEVILNAKVPRQAARLAYYAQFHAAQALIFERAEKIAKTHKGVDREFHKIAKWEVTFAPGFAALLTKAYNYKDHADYNRDLSEPITPAVASDAIVTATQFVACVRQALASPSAAPVPEVQ